MKLLPSKKQWKDWTLPSKIGVIGGYAGILAIPLALILFVLSCILQPNINEDEIVSRIAHEYEKVLNKKYPIAHTVFGVYQNKTIVPSGQMPENLKVYWNTGQVQSTGNNKLEVTLPNIILNGTIFIGSIVTKIEKRIGAKSRSLIKMGGFEPRLEVIGIDGDLVVVALGFPNDDSEN